MACVFALHGFTGTAASFETLASEHRVVAPVLIGHGQPPAGLEVASFEAEVERLAEQLDACELDPARPLANASAPQEKPVLLGYSMGGRLALALALRWPSRFRALVLVSSSAGLADEAERQARRASDGRWIELLEREGLSAFVAQWQAQSLFETQRALPVDVLERERRARLSHSPAGLAHALRVTGLAEMPNYWSRLGELGLPVTLLAGARDARFVAIARQMAAKIPNAQFTEVPEVGHNLLLERPSAVLRAIEKGLHS